MAVAAAAEPLPKDTRNAAQRKLAVMYRCGAITNDKVYSATAKSTGELIQFPYTSIQAVSEGVRQACVEEGLDVRVRPWPDPDERRAMVLEVVRDLAAIVGIDGERTDNSTPPGLIERMLNDLPLAGSWMQVEFVNADDHADRIISRWKIVEGDKGWAYSTKFPLVRALLIGDAAEPDEADMAAAAARQQEQAAAAARATQARTAGTPPRTGVPPQPPRQQPAAQRPPADTQVYGDCPECAPTGVRGTVMLRQRPQDPAKPYFCVASRKGCNKSLEAPVAGTMPGAPEPAAQQPTAAAEPTQEPQNGQQTPSNLIVLNLDDDQKAALRSKFGEIPRDRRPSRERFGELAGRGFEQASRALAVMVAAAALPEAARPDVDLVDKAVEAGLDQAEAWVRALGESAAQPVGGQ